MSEKFQLIKSVEELKKEVRALKDFAQEELQNEAEVNDKVKQQLTVLVEDALRRLFELKDVKGQYQPMGLLGLWVDLISLKQELLTGKEVHNSTYDLAKSHKTPSGALELLAKDTDDKVRANVARNPNTPAKVLEELAKDDSTLVILGLAGNRNTPFKILSEFTVKKYAHSIAETAYRTLRRLKEDEE